MPYEIKQTGDPKTFESGARRDSQGGKPRFDLIPPHALRRVAMHYASGADHYGDWNWHKGIPFSRMLASLHRHVQHFAAGESEEDHLAAIVFNALGIMQFQEEGREDLDDRQVFTKKNLTSEPDLPKNCQSDAEDHRRRLSRLIGLARKAWSGVDDANS